MAKYKNHTVFSNSFIKRFSHQGRFKKALSLIGSSEEKQSILDFGTGDGYFIDLLNQEKHNLNIYGYEPVEYMFNQIEVSNTNINLIKNLEEVSNKTFDFITCLEVLEHFDKKDQHKLIQEIKDKLKPNGKIIISVPIEVGFSSLLKNITRVILRHLEKDTSFKNIFRAFFALPIKRSKTDMYISSHIGFNYKKLEEVFAQENLIIKKRDYSPLKLFKAYINSQVFYVLQLDKN